MSPLLLRSSLVAAGVIAAVAIAYFFFSPTEDAPLPPPFSAARTVAQAREASAASGRPILVFADAGWCAYCRKTRRSVLTDPRVFNLVRDSVEPLYLDLSSSQTDPAVAQLAADLWITEVPTLALVDKGHTLGRLVGLYDADTVADWLASRAEHAPAKPGKRGVLPR